MAAKEHLFDPVLSLNGGTTTSTEDSVADPGPNHPPKTFLTPCGTTTDSHGDIYVASSAGGSTAGRIDVFDSQGHFLTEIPSEYEPCGLAVDSEGNLYTWTYTQDYVYLFKPKAYPPKSGTEYAPTRLYDPHEHGNPGAELCLAAWSVAVDPSSDHLYIAHICRVEEYGSAAEGSPLIDEHVAGADELGSFGDGMDVYGKNHDVYLTSNKSEKNRVFVLAGTDGHTKCTVDGAETAAGSFSFGLGSSIAVDQANGDFYVWDYGHKVIDQYAVKGEECKFIGSLPKPPTLKGIDPFNDLAVDDPLKADEAGYDSPNEGYVYATSGSTATNSRLFAFAPVFTGEATLTLHTTGTGSGTVECEIEGGSAEACAVRYPTGTKLTLTATPDPGSTFSGWSGSGCSGTASCKVTMTEAKSVTAEFTEEEAGPVFHTLTVSVTGNGSISADSGTISGCTSAGGPTCEGEYEQGAQVTLTETPGEGSLFASWQTLQCDESTATTCEVTIGSGDEGVAASFQAAQTLKVAIEGPGTITSSPGLISCTPFCEDSFPQGTKVTLSATPAPGSLFIAWKHCDSGGVLGAHCTVTMDKAKTVTAVFASGHALTVKSSGLGKVQSSPAAISCLYGCQSTTAVFNATTKVTLKETPAKHFHFAGFSGDCTGTGPCEVAMGAEREVKALFVRNTAYSLTLTRTGAGKGIVRSHPAGINCGYTCISVAASYDEGEEVLLEVSKVALGSAFGGWSGGGCSGTAPTCTVAISEAKEVKAEFK
jgi:hypothetical protein